MLVFLAVSGRSHRLFIPLSVLTAPFNISCFAFNGLESLHVAHGGVFRASPLVCEEVSPESFPMRDGRVPDLEGMVVFRGVAFGHFPEFGVSFR